MIFFTRAGSRRFWNAALRLRCVVSYDLLVGVKFFALPDSIYGHVLSVQDVTRISFEIDRRLVQQTLHHDKLTLTFGVS